VLLFKEDNTQSHPMLYDLYCGFRVAFACSSAALPGTTICQSAIKALLSKPIFLFWAYGVVQSHRSHACSFRLWKQMFLNCCFGPLCSEEGTVVSFFLSLFYALMKFIPLQLSWISHHDGVWNFDGTSDNLSRVTTSSMCSTVAWTTFLCLAVTTIFLEWLKCSYLRSSTE